MLSLEIVLNAQTRHHRIVISARRPGLRRLEEELVGEEGNNEGGMKRKGLLLE